MKIQNESDLLAMLDRKFRSASKQGQAAALHLGICVERIRKALRDGARPWALVALGYEAGIWDARAHEKTLDDTTKVQRMVRVRRSKQFAEGKDPDTRVEWLVKEIKSHQEGLDKRTRSVINKRYRDRFEVGESTRRRDWKKAEKIAAMRRY